MIFIKAGKYVCTICGAPSVLIRAGVLDGRKAAVSPAGHEEMKANAEYVDEWVVSDRKLIISQSPGTAMEFLAEAGGGFCWIGEDEGDQKADAGNM